jgi:hypothetical protein
MAKHAAGGLTRTTTEWLSSTPRRTFLLFPALVVAVEFFLRGPLDIHWAGVPLLVRGNLQCRMSGVYRTRRGGVAPAFTIRPCGSSPSEYTA